jgi:hypothetical protein
MWRCTKCREQVDEGFEVCWNCGTSKEGIEDPEFRRAEQIRAEEMEPVTSTPDSAPARDGSTAIREMSDNAFVEHERLQGGVALCLRCDREIVFVGTKSFHEGFQWGVFGDLAELFVNKEAFDLYVCRQCGRVEFFVSGVGEHLRPGKTTD